MTVRDLPETLVPAWGRAARPAGLKYGDWHNPPTRIFYDFEFLEDGRTIDVISIGMVVCIHRQDIGRYQAVAEVYAVNESAPWDRISEHKFLRNHVLPSLPGGWTGQEGSAVWRPDPNNPAVMPLGRIAQEVAPVIQLAPRPELWGWYSAYDHVALAQLWGPMADLPEGVPMFTNDLKQEAVRQGNPPLPEQVAGEHNALEDARHNVIRARALGVIW